VAERYANLYLDTSAMPYPWKIAEAVRSIGAERVLYASDGPGCNPKLEVEKVRMLGLPEEQERLVLGVNAAPTSRPGSGSWATVAPVPVSHRSHPPPTADLHLRPTGPRGVSGCCRSCPWLSSAISP